MQISYKAVGMVKILRTMRGLTQEQLGGLLRPPRPGAFVSRVEGLKSAKVTQAIAASFAEALGSSIEELFVSK